MTEVRRTSPGIAPGFAGLDLLKRLYLGRMIVVAGIMLAALLAWGQADPEETFLATSMFVLSLLVTAGAFWHSHIQRAGSGTGFLAGQVFFDVLLVTGIVHLTGGGDSQFAWLYILVISEGSLLLPLPWGLVTGPLAALLYFTDLVWGYSESLSWNVFLQIGLFGLVAFVTGIIGDRLRRAGIALGDAESELQRLRKDTANILKTISTGIVTVEAPGRLLYMNPAAQKLLGLDGRGWRGAEASEVFGGVAPGLLALLQRALDEGVTPTQRPANHARCQHHDPHRTGPSHRRHRDLPGHHGSREGRRAEPPKRAAQSRSRVCPRRWPTKSRTLSRRSEAPWSSSRDRR